MTSTSSSVVFPLDVADVDGPASLPTSIVRESLPFRRFLPLSFSFAAVRRLPLGDAYLGEISGLTEEPDVDINEDEDGDWSDVLRSLSSSSRMLYFRLRFVIMLLNAPMAFWNSPPRLGLLVI